MVYKLLTELLERARRHILHKDPRLSERERLVVEVTCMAKDKQAINEQSIEDLVNEPSTGDAERDEFKDVVRKIDDADRDIHSRT